MSDADDPKPESATPPAEPAEPAPLAETQELAPEDRPEPRAEVEPARQVVYVHAPTPPKVRHNRLFAALIELLGVVAFALVYLGAAAAYIGITPHASFEPTIAAFVNGAAFWVPVLFYAIAAVVLGLLLNRAAWWVHVLGSLAVAAFVFWASVGTLTLTQNIITMTPDQAAAVFWFTVGQPILLFAAIMAREVAMWFGLAISIRGRKVKARNAEARAAYDAEQAEKRAEYERAGATV